jgi:hypothetical protein
MGNWFSADTPMFTIGIKTVRRNQMKSIKTYQDALRVMGLDCKDGEKVMVVLKGERVVVPVHETFQIVDSLEFKGRSIPLRRLYGRSS